jgi:branched-chain amino acid transport system substrate-binding protein
MKLGLARAFALAVAASCCFGVASAQDTIAIGAVFPLSGPNADYGDIFMSGTSIALEHVNADKTLSRPLTILYEDSQGTPQRGAVAINKLINVEHVPYALTAFTGVSKAIAPVAARAKVVLANGGGIGPDLATLGPYFWNVLPLVNEEVRALIPYIVKERGWKRITLVYLDEPIGEEVLKELRSGLDKEGGSVVAALAVPASAQQFGTVAAKVRDSNPDAVYIALAGSQQAQLIKQLRDNGVQAPLLSNSALATPAVLNLPEAKGAIYTSQKLDWSAGDPVTARFVADFRKKYQKDPSPYAANYYNAVLVFAKLAQRLEKQGKPITGESLLAALAENRTFDVVGGRLEFLGNGTVTMPIAIKAVGGRELR